jgi:hypothetical protein
VKRSKPPRNGDHSRADGRRRGETAHPQEAVRPSAPATFLESQQRRCSPSDSAQTFAERKRLFLAVGDEVSHMRYEQWGIGVVTETMTSSVPGGTCLARVRFQDGQLRCFNNDLDNESCCYYFGVRRYWNPSHGVDALRTKFLMLKG